MTSPVLAGVLLGFDRSERGKPARLGTTTLVCLAARASFTNSGAK
jgi:uncharacterized membrane protein YhiD involved in acid resistance